MCFVFGLCILRACFFSLFLLIYGFKGTDFARVEGATESNVNVVVEEARIVAHRVRMGHRRSVRDGAVHEVVEVDIVDTLRAAVNSD